MVRIDVLLKDIESFEERNTSYLELRQQIEDIIINYDMYRENDFKLDE